MSRLSRIILNHKCRSLTDYLLVHALERLEADEQSGWADLLRIENEALLSGAHAPARQLKDYRNHVLLVSDGEWGGARDKATEWYGEVVAAMRAKNWDRAAYAIGMLGFYYTSVFHPLNTAQSDRVSAARFAVAHASYRQWPEIFAELSKADPADVLADERTGFVSDMLIDGAKLAHRHVGAVLDRFDLGKAELPVDLIAVYAGLSNLAISGLATLIRRAAEEAGVDAPRSHPLVAGAFASLDVPRHAMGKRRAHGRAKSRIARMRREYDKTGKVIRALPPFDRAIRKLHARQLLRTPLRVLDDQPVRPLGKRAEDQDAAAPSKAYWAKPKAGAAPRTGLSALMLEGLDEAQDAPVEVPEPTPAKPAVKVRDVLPEDADAALAEFHDDAEDEIEAAINAPLDADTQAELAQQLEEEVEQEAVSEAITADLELFEEDDDALPATPLWDAERLQPDASIADALALEDADVIAELSSLGIETVEDLLISDAGEVAEYLGMADLQADTIGDWQDQAGLMMEVGGLRALDAQILTGAGITSSKQLAAASASDLLRAAQSFLATPRGSHISLDDEDDIDEADAQHWVDLAKRYAS